MCDRMSRSREVNFPIPEVCIDERRLPLFIARATLRDLIQHHRIIVQHFGDGSALRQTFHFQCCTILRLPLCSTTGGQTLRLSVHRPRLSATDQITEPMVKSAPITGSISEAWT